MLLLDKEQSVSFLSAAFRFCQLFISDLRRILFRHRNTQFCGDLAYQFIRHLYSSLSLFLCFYLFFIFPSPSSPVATECLDVSLSCILFLSHFIHWRV